jgi:hypothetical protein
MRSGLINRAEMLRIAIGRARLERVVPSFHSITKLKNFIGGSAKAGT